MSNSNPTDSDQPQPQRQPQHQPSANLPIESGEPTVPAFGCVVYFANQGGEFHGRVANLEGIQVTASDQRQMLVQIVAQFKTAVRESLNRGETPDWIDPPKEKAADEKKLFLPVHL